jgi:2-polyprenyl-3-methyl-5-hydroxy-6-metoxy-1,4-benzoquinol methylase
MSMSDAGMKVSATASPGKFFEWCMTHADTKDVPFRANYPQYFANAGEADYLWRSYDRRLDDIIPFARPGVRVLEIGCGIGADLHWLALAGADATGIDVKSEWITAARSLTQTVRQHFGPVKVDIRRINLLDLGDEQFDLIYMKDTFHHLEPRVDIVDKIARLLAPGGGSSSSSRTPGTR